MDLSAYTELSRHVGLSRQRVTSTRHVSSLSPSVTVTHWGISIQKCTHWEFSLQIPNYRVMSVRHVGSSRCLKTHLIIKPLI